MKTTKINTRFMQGNKDIDNYIFDVVVEKIGIKEAMMIDFDFDNAIYSDGFINAVERGLKPDFNSLKESLNIHSDNEYHHVILDNKCYVVFFN